MKDEKIPDVVKKCYEKLPHFSDGRVDYSAADVSPTLISFLKCGNEILILKRSEKVGTYRNRWSVIAGYLDELKPVGEKVKEEVKEETGVEDEKISSIELGDSFRFEGEKTTWVPHPALVEVEDKPEIDLNWEHTDYKWVKKDEIDDYLSRHLLKGLEKVLPDHNPSG